MCIVCTGEQGYCGNLLTIVRYPSNMYHGKLFPGNDFLEQDTISEYIVLEMLFRVIWNRHHQQHHHFHIYLVSLTMVMDCTGYLADDGNDDAYNDDHNDDDTNDDDNDDTNRW